MSSHDDRPQESSSAEEHGVGDTSCVPCAQHEEDVQAPLLTAPFPFFRLPLDIRRMIYEEVFRAPLADKTITPDRSYRRRKLGRRFAERTVNYDLALLRSCQQAHNEASGTLYGSQVFYFDDTSYGHENAVVEASAYCYYCSGEGSMTTYNRCLDAYNGKHYVKIPHCDFVEMYDWLLNIGERNRLKIRHIHISFSSSQFAKVLGEQHLVDNPLKPSPVGGDLIEKALALLACGHNLNTFGISFRQRYLDLSDIEDGAGVTSVWAQETNASLIWTAFERIFSNGLNHRLKNALCKVRGIRTLNCDLALVTPQPSGSWTDEGAHALEGFKEVKEHMEAGYADRQMVEAPERTFSIPFVDQSSDAIHGRKSFATISSSDGAFERSPEPTSATGNTSFARQCRPLTLDSAPQAADFLLFREL